MLVVALAGPPGVVGPFGVRAQGAEEAEQPERQPFWKVLRPGPLSDPDTSKPAADNARSPRWTERNLNAVHFATDEVGYAVGNDGTVLKTHDRGDTWRVQRLTGEGVGQLSGVQVVEVGVDEDGAYTGEDEVVVVGNSGFIVRTVDGGETWRRVVARFSTGASHLNGVHFPPQPGVSPRELVGYAVGNTDNNRYTVLKTQDGGRSWSRLDSLDNQDHLPTSQNLLAVHFLSEETGVAVGVSAYLRTEDGGGSWEGLIASPPGNIRGVALLQTGDPERVVGYAVGSVSGASTVSVGPVRRTEDGFRTSGNTERAPVTSLNGVVAYYSPEGAEVVHAVGAQTVGAVQTRTQDPNVRWVIEPIEDWHRNRDELKAISVSSGGGTVVAVGAGGLMLRRTTDPRAAADLCVPRELAGQVLPALDPVEKALDDLRSVLGGGSPAARGALAEALEGAAETVEAQKGEDSEENEALNSALDALAAALRGLAQALDPEEEGEVPWEAIEGLLDDLEGQIRALAEPVRDQVANALKFAAETVRPQRDENQGPPAEDEQPESLLWDLADVVEALAAAVEETDERQAAQEAAEAARLPDLPVCPDTTPEQREVPEAEQQPPAITLSLASGSPGDQFTVSGVNWGERGSVRLWFDQQDEEPIPLSEPFLAQANGQFSRSVNVPPQAVPGADTLVRAVGEEETVERTFTVPTPGSPGGPPPPGSPKIVPSPGQVRPRATFDVTGTDWLASHPKWVGVRVGLFFEQCKNKDGDALSRQQCAEAGGKAKRVVTPLLGGEAVQASNTGKLAVTAALPDEAVPGMAIVRAEAVGQPRPHVDKPAEADFEVLTECGFRLDQTKPEFPCLTDVELVDEGENRVLSAGAVPYFDPGLGEDGRAVIVSGGSRVHLYDLADRYVEVVSVAEDLSHATVKINDETYDRAAPGRALAMGFVIDKIGKGEKTGKCVTFRKGGEPAFDVCEGKRVQQGLRQRGVPGFGKHFSGRSAEAETSGVVNLEDAGLIGTNRSVLDTERHRLYFFGARQLPDLSSGIAVMSLTGEFPPRVFNFEAEFLPGFRITRLGVDGPNGMLYVATTAGTGGIVQFVATTTPQRDVHIHAIRVRVVGEGDDAQVVLDHRWSLHVGDLCSTVVKQTHGLWVSRKDGRLLSLPCQGTDFSVFGNPQASPNGILTVTLPPGKSPRDLVKDETRDDTAEFTRRFEVVPGGGQGALSRHQVNGDQAARVLTWQIGNLLLVWDVDEGMWIGALQTRGGLVAADPASRRLYLDNSDALTLFQVTNLPGSTERTRVPVGFTGVLPGGAFDPRTRRLVVGSMAPQPLRVLEDRISPPIAFADPSPDSRTHDIDEGAAFSVDRRGATAAYGARVWWTGLKGTLPGQYDGITSGGSTSADGPGPPPGLTWDWLVYGGPNNPLGARLSTLPWRPHETKREVFSARVEDTSLAVQDSALGSATGLSDATAWGLDIDDGTGQDVRSRRGTRDWREVGALQVEKFCDNFSGSAQQDCRKRWFGDPDDPDDKGFKEDWERFYYGGSSEGFRSQAAGLGQAFCESLPQGQSQCMEEWQKFYSGFSGQVAEGMKAFCDSSPQGEFRDRCRQEWRKFYDGGSSGGANDQLRRPDECFIELYDRAFREVDGERQVHITDEEGNPNPCFGAEALEKNAPQGSPKLPTEELKAKEEEHEKGPGLEQHTGLTQRAHCVDPGRKDEREASTGASTVSCDLSGGITKAGAESASSENVTANDAFPLELPEGVTVRVDGTVTNTHSVRDPKRGMVSVAEALAQGVEVEVKGLGRLRIGQVATRAETWATGRPGGAGSTYKVGYSDVEVHTADGEVAFSCDPHGDLTYTHPHRETVDEHKKKVDEQAAKVWEAAGGEPGATCDPQQISAAVGRVFGGVVEMVAPARDTGPNMLGTLGGAQAIVRRDRRGYWNDRVLFPDVVRDELPGLQLTINADGTEFNRYRIDLAAVFAESTYYIGEPFEALKELPASIEVSLADLGGTPLAGGRFEVISDHDADGALGAADAAVARCTTGSDGVGDCRISSLPAGSYLVRQLEAPPGYLAQQAPVVVHAAAGSVQTVPFVNALNAGTVEVTLVDPDGSPLAGGGFELTHESGASESCTTDAEGRCSHFPLPLGAYTLTQTRAPRDYEPAEAVRFELTSPGQIARIQVVNGLGGQSGAEVVIIEGAELAASKSDDNGSWWKRVARGLAQVIRRNPWQAVAFGLLGLILATPGYLAARRRELSIMRELT